MKLLAKHELRHFFHCESEKADVGGKQSRHFYVEVDFRTRKLTFQQKKFGGVENALFSPDETVFQSDGNEKHYWIFQLDEES